MKRHYIYIITILFPLFSMQAQTVPVEKERIEILSGELKLTLMVGNDDRLYQLGFGDAAEKIEIPQRLPSREWEFFPPSGNGVITEPALQVTHADGNTSTELHYVRHEKSSPETGVELTSIFLKDPVYPFFVTIHIRCYPGHSMMEMWNTLTHEEPGEVVLYKYASASPVFRSKSYWLTQFSGNYKREATLTEEKLTEGIKILDSKLGIRAHQMRIPSFILSMDAAACEHEGEVFAASLQWSGSFQLAFDMDWNKNLRVLTGIHSAGSHYYLDKGKTFTTPGILWTYGKQGKGDISRKFHHWASQYAIRDPHKDRPVLLNNWEATYCDFDEQRLTGLFDGARQIGAELFLLDDGWFGNGPYSRDDDKHGLGDWEVSKKKLPRGLSYLGDEARKRDIGFGIWLEPEMVNPRSELYQKHPDWIITQLYREAILGRHQEILDLTRPEVQEYEWQVIDQTLRPNPGISYVKWDCNRYVTQGGSSFLSPERQSHLLLDYNWELYRLMERFATGFPNVMGMICAGGSGRVDYGSLRYFHSFWPSDNTDPLGRIKIQWGFSHFFPASTISAHVTRMGKRHMKLAIDVALSGSFGIDLALDKATPEEREQLAEGVRIYKSSIRELIMQGDLYRLVSPYEYPMASLSYVSQDRSRAVFYLYQTEEGKSPVVFPQGLDPDRDYVLEEINLPKGTHSLFTQHGKKIKGDRLMKEGIQHPLTKQFESAVLLLKAQ